MKVKNKIITTLLMLTCIVGLTACGSEEAVSEFTNSKIEADQAKVESIISIVTDLNHGTLSFDGELSEYNNVELASEFSDMLVEQKGVELEAEGKAVKSAISSFKSAEESIGAITSLDTNSVEVTVDDDTIILNVPVTCENGSGKIEFIFSNDIYGVLESCTFNTNQSVSELMGRAGLNTVIGMGTVFVVLILISLIISCFGVIPKIQESFSKKNAADSEPVVEVAPAEEVAEELADDTELVAVIAAAIAAYEGTSTDGFVVRSIKRSKSSKWNRA